MLSAFEEGDVIEQLQKAGARMIGVVLNRVKLDRNKYYYSPYYHREYTEYYADSKTA